MPILVRKWDILKLLQIALDHSYSAIWTTAVIPLSNVSSDDGLFDRKGKEYTDIVIRQLELMPPDTVIQRLTGDGARSDLIAPLWSLKKFEVLNAIDKEMQRRQTYQGRLFKGESL